MALDDSHAVEASRAVRTTDRPGMFGRLFTGLEPAIDPELAPDAARALGREAVERVLERCRACDQCAASVPAGAARPTGALAAGYTYFGQLVAHDVSFDPLSTGARERDATRLRSYRTPALDLDCLYGRGPEVDGHLYASAWGIEGSDEGLARIQLALGRAENPSGENSGERDLPRTSTWVAPLDGGRVFARRRSNENALAALHRACREAVGRPLHEVIEPADLDLLRPALRRRRVRGDVARVTPDPRTVVRGRAGVEVGWFARTVGNGLVRGTVDGDPTPRLWEVDAGSLRRIGRATVADPRNDENVLVAHVHIALASFHNEVVRRLAGGDRLDADGQRRVFAEARRLVRWHYQWLVLEDYLPRITQLEVLAEARALARDGRQSPLYSWADAPFVPLEFAAGAFRAPHAMIRAEYALNDRLRGPVPIFAPDPGTGAGVEDLRGGRPLVEDWSLQWDRFFGANAQRAMKLGPRYSEPLTRLPDGRGGTASVLELDLARGWHHQLPTGEDVARRLGLDPLGSGRTPLLLHVLAEAAHGGGERLGPVGSSIVAHTLVGLVAADPGSYLSSEPGWTPSAGPIFERDAIDLADLAAAGGLPRTADEWRQSRGEPF